MKNLVKVIIRKDNYDIVSMERNIDGIDSLIYSPECFLGNDVALNEYINANKYNVVNTLEPVDEGLIVFDLKTRTLIVSVHSYVNKKPYLFYNTIKNTVEFAHSAYEKQEFVELLEKGYIKSLNNENILYRLSLTGITDLESFEQKVHHYYNQIKVGLKPNESLLLELEIEKNHFDRYFWTALDLRDVRLKMKELGIVFHKKDEVLWSEYLTKHHI